MGLLKKLATTYSLDYFTFNPYSIDDATRDIREAWGETEGHILYVVSETKKDACVRLRSCSWLTTVVSKWHDICFLTGFSVCCRGQVELGKGHKTLVYSTKNHIMHYVRSGWHASQYYVDLSDRSNLCNLDLDLIFVLGNLLKFEMPVT